MASVKAPAKSSAKSRAKTAVESAAKSKSRAKTAAKSLTRQAATPKPVAGASPLARASEHLAAGALGAALDDLLAAWASHKASELASLVEALGAHVARALPAIDAKPRALDGPWREIADQRRSADVPRLVAAFEPATAKQILGWLDVLELFPPDPRIAAAAVAETTHFVSSSAGPTRTRAFRLVDKLADPGCIPLIEKAITRCRGMWNADELRDRLRKVLAKLSPAPALAASDKAAVATLAKTISKLAKGPAPDASVLDPAPRASSGADAIADRLLREVYDDPASDGPRLVYADFLQQAGDPRGELIALQLQPALTRAQDKRVQALVRDKQNLARWLGPLVAVVRAPVFARGFLHACKVELATAKHHALLADPAWATVEQVRAIDPAVLVSPAMRALRHVVGMPVEQLVSLVAHPQPLALERISEIPFTTYAGREAAKLGADNSAAWKALATVGALGKLRDVGMLVSWDLEESMLVPSGVDWLLRSKLGKQLRSLSLQFRDAIPRVVDWMPVFRSHPTLEQLELCAGYMEKTGMKIHFSVRIERAKSKLAISVECTNDYWTTEWPEMFAELPQPSAPVLSIIFRGKAGDVAALREQVSGLHARFERVDLTTA